MVVVLFRDVLVFSVCRSDLVCASLELFLTKIYYSCDRVSRFMNDKIYTPYAILIDKPPTTLVMPSVEPSLVAGKKRKSTEKHDARKRTTGPTDGSDQELDSEILRLELELSQSRKYYNNFIILFEYAFPKKPAPVSSLAVIVLCRAFSRLLADGSLKQKDRMTKAESAVQKWLNDIYRQYTTALLEILTHGPSAYELDPLQLLMRLVKQEVSSQGSKQWAEGLFGQTLREMLAEGEICAHIRAQFIKQYFKYDDVRFHTLAVLP